MRGVSAATWKRLQRLESAKTAVKYVGAWPDLIYDPDEWSAIAEPMQEALFLSTLGREPEPDSAPARDPMDVTRLHPEPTIIRAVVHKRPARQSV